MKGLVVPGAFACVIAFACTPPPATNPPQRVPPVSVNPPLVLPPFQMDSGLTADRVPPFQPLPLIVWGPPPAGVSHPERARTYDLQHQATTVRFDWPRQAVVGTTTLRLAGLPGPTPLSTIAQDTRAAGDTLVETLIATIEHRHPESILLPVRLVVRGSS